MKLNPHLDWRDLRKALTEQYSDTSHSYVTKSRLRELSQQPSESIQNFAEGIFAMADETYFNHNLYDPLIQGMLVDVLIENVLNDAVSRKLIRERPRTLQEAFKSAIKEQVDQRSFEARGGVKLKVEEPMEISAVSNTDQKINKKSLANILHKLNTKLDSILAVK